MSTDMRTHAGATLLGRNPSTGSGSHGASPTVDPPREETAGTTGPRFLTPELARALAEVKGQAQFLLYLADQLEDSLQQLDEPHEPGHEGFLCRILGMYSSQLETKHHELGDRIAEASQEMYVTVRELDRLSL